MFGFKKQFCWDSSLALELTLTLLSPSLPQALPLVPARVAGNAGLPHQGVTVTSGCLTPAREKLKILQL